MKIEMKEVPGFDGYWASSDGYIYKDDPDFPGEQIQVGHYPNGYDTPYVYIDGNHYTVAKLVALAFLENNIGENAVVFHLDGNPRNNSVDNIIFVSPSERRLLTSKNNLPNMYMTYLKEIRSN